MWWPGTESVYLCALRALNLLILRKGIMAKSVSLGWSFYKSSTKTLGEVGQTRAATNSLRIGRTPRSTRPLSGRNRTAGSGASYGPAEMQMPDGGRLNHRAPGGRRLSQRTAEIEQSALRRVAVEVPHGSNAPGANGEGDWSYLKPAL